ncbi:MAG: glycosyltransferase family 39 protein, partial [Frankiales bacterium]|nr:glycosyltransferase family 39 protein [Frankiales bacterium]
MLRTAWVRWAPVLLLVLGAEMRLRQWFGGRSLWLDEALIARSLVSRDYVGLVSSPLQGDQAGPVLWLWSTRLSLDLFGDGERALRLVPLLGGLAALVLTWRMAKRLLPDVLVPVALLVTVLSPSLLYFSNEVKPYSVDVAVCLALILLALR